MLKLLKPIDDIGVAKSVGVRMMRVSQTEMPFIDCLLILRDIELSYSKQSPIRVEHGRLRIERGEQLAIQVYSLKPDHFNDCLVLKRLIFCVYLIAISFMLL